jgi:ferredoxin-type protein NapG
MPATEPEEWSDERLTRRRMLGRLLAGAGAAIAGTTVIAAVPRAADAEVLRPPGALEEQEFLSTCIRCGRCADACPNRCITAFTAEAGREASVKPSLQQYSTPVIFPRRQACMLCNGMPGDYLACTDACPTGALLKIPKDHASVQEQVDMGIAEVDTNLCYSYNGASCGACVRACPFEGSALRAGLWEKPLIDPSACVGCGLCERSCIRYPQAIRVRPRGKGEQPGGERAAKRKVVEPVA